MGIEPSTLQITVRGLSTTLGKRTIKLLDILRFIRIKILV